METLQQERRVHALTIDMGNLCGQLTTEPGGGRASSLAANVTCTSCQEILRQLREAVTTS